jgi:hypothetical protein
VVLGLIVNDIQQLVSKLLSPWGSFLVDRSIQKKQTLNAKLTQDEQNVLGTMALVHLHC